jgi:hypothetical protein
MSREQFLVAVALLSPSQSLPMMRTAPTECPLENGNLLDVHLFISDEAQCKQLCQANEVLDSTCSYTHSL